MHARGPAASFGTGQKYSRSTARRRSHRRPVLSALLKDSLPTISWVFPRRMRGERIWALLYRAIFWLALLWLGAYGLLEPRVDDEPGPAQKVSMPGPSSDRTFWWNLAEK